MTHCLFYQYRPNIQSTSPSLISISTGGSPGGNLIPSVLSALGCFPTDIVGIANYLEDKDVPQQTAVSFWPRSFCSALEGIMVHPIFEMDPSKVALAIQYAVIHRT